MSELSERLEELLFASTCEPFSEVERAELNALLRNHTDARNFAARYLTIDALLTENLAASKHGAAFQPYTISTERLIRRPNWLARAAAWIGAFHLFSNTAKATTVIIMKKTVTSVTAAILVIGGSGIYIIHRNNESSRARVATMETEIQSLSDQLGIKSARTSSRKTGTSISSKNVSIIQVLAVLGRSEFSMRDKLLLSRFREQLAAMDVESLKNLLLDAEKISNPIPDSLAAMVMRGLISKDPAEATQLATRFIVLSAEFQFQMSHAAADAFKAWQAKDPTAADAWYVATAAAGGLYSKGIAPNGLENLTIDRSLARLRFAAQVVSNPAEATAMLRTMRSDDVIASLKEVTDPNAIRQILPMLSPEQKVSAAEGVIKDMAASDPNAAFAWAMTLGMTDEERDTLMASGIEAAVTSGKLDLTGVSEWSKELKLVDERRSQLLVSAATSVSLKPRNDKNRIDSENNVDWDRVSELIDWLRKEAPSESAGKAVGEYLGKLSYESHNLGNVFQGGSGEDTRKRMDEFVTSYQTQLASASLPKLKEICALLEKEYPLDQKDTQMTRNVWFIIMDLAAKSDPAWAFAKFEEVSSLEKTPADAALATFRRWAIMNGEPMNPSYAAVLQKWLDEAQAAGRIEEGNPLVAELRADIAATQGDFSEAVRQISQMPYMRQREAAIKHVAELQSPEAQKRAMEELSTALHGQNLPHFVREFADQQGFDVAREILESASLTPEKHDLAAASIASTNIGSETPTKAKWFLESLRSEDMRAVVEFADRWTHADYQRAAQWLNSLPAGKQRDTAVAGFAPVVAKIDGATAVDWALSLTDSSQREACLEEVHRVWKALDPEAASSYLKQKGIAER